MGNHKMFRYSLSLGSKTERPRFLAHFHENEMASIQKTINLENQNQNLEIHKKVSIDLEWFSNVGHMNHLKMKKYY